MQAMNNPYENPESNKKSKTWLIILIVLLVLSCCCIVSILVLYFWLGDLILEQIEPYLMSISAMV